jgi:hypothetical protein
MIDNQRRYRRLDKILTMQFCFADASPKVWDISTIENISPGGVRFKVPSDLKLKDKIIYVQIRVPELAHRLLKLEAIVINTKSRSNIKFSDVRAKFINLTDDDKELLSVLEKIIDLQVVKNAKRDLGK